MVGGQEEGDAAGAVVDVGAEDDRFGPRRRVHRSLPHAASVRQTKGVPGELPSSL